MISVDVTKDGQGFTARNRTPVDGRLFAETGETRDQALCRLYAVLQAHGCKSLVKVAGQSWDEIFGL